MAQTDQTPAEQLAETFYQAIKRYLPTREVRDTAYTALTALGSQDAELIEEANDTVALFIDDQDSVEVDIKSVTLP